MKYNIYTFIWDTMDILYKLTGIRFQQPIELLFPNFTPWLFGKMLNVSFHEVKNDLV